MDRDAFASLVRGACCRAAIGAVETGKIDPVGPEFDSLIAAYDETAARLATAERVAAAARGLRDDFARRLDYHGLSNRNWLMVSPDEMRRWRDGLAAALDGAPPDPAGKDATP